MKKPPDRLMRVVSEQKQGVAAGIYSVCSANRFVIEACMKQARWDGAPLLIESTANQVNQYGGYTGMNPEQFAGYVHQIARVQQFPPEDILLGGDHLGPTVWQMENAESAMAKSRELVRDCALAGYTKIHLDASMRCASDPAGCPLDKAVAAERAADLCAAAESACAQLPASCTAPVYVIGTEVPLPGGVQAEEDGPTVTQVQDAEETVETTRRAFLRRGLDAAWERTIALVVQPGVEYGNDSLYEYDRTEARQLAAFIEAHSNLIYEAHSTDYQTGAALRALVEDHFAVLKVGPGLTFAFREAVFALAMMEEEWLAGRGDITLSGIQQALDKSMLENPVYWEKYYPGDEKARRFARKYSYSDRSRYYWLTLGLTHSLERLLNNLATNPPPLPLISQFMPAQYQRIREGQLNNDPSKLIHDKIMEVAASYASACGYAR